MRAIREFYLSDSAASRLDPRVKIALTVIFSLVVALADSIFQGLLALIAATILTFIVSIPISALAGRLLIVNGFIFFLWLFLPFTYTGEAVYSIGPLTIYWEGVRYCILITLKSNAIILVIIALLGTSSIFTLVHGLSHMHAPEKLTHLFFFCFRYIHVIVEEFNRLRDAARVRGFKPTFSIHAYRTYAYFIGMILVRSFDRSKRILAAMRCRGFKGKFYILHHYGMGGSDYAIVFFMVIIIVCLLLAPIWFS